VILTIKKIGFDIGNFLWHCFSLLDCQWHSINFDTLSCWFFSSELPASGNLSDTNILLTFCFPHTTIICNFNFIIDNLEQVHWIYLLHTSCTILSLLRWYLGFDQVLVEWLCYCSSPPPPSQNDLTPWNRCKCKSIKMHILKNTRVWICRHATVSNWSGNLCYKLHLLAHNWILFFNSQYFQMLPLWL